MNTSAATPASTPTAFIGCDVGKSEIVVFDSRTRRSQTLRNTPAGLEEFAQHLDAACLAICEATGGYEAELLHALAGAGRAVHRADPAKVRAFIRSFGTLGKTDCIDAQALAVYGAERHSRLPLWQPPEAARDRLHELVMLRRDLVEDRTAWHSRAVAPGAAERDGYIRPVLTCLEDSIAAIDADIAAIIASSQSLRRDADALCEIPGIGLRTAAALLALMPELGSLTRRQAAALAGLAPHPRQSGASNAYRRAKGGRPELKRTLFMPAMVAGKHHPELRAFRQRLLEQGKKPLVVLVAIMRKLIVIANAVLRDANRRSLVRA